MAKKWTNAEKKTVQDCIIANPGNLDQSFETAAALLVDRTQNACRAKWYGTSFKHRTKYVNALRYENRIFFTESAPVLLPNTKNVWRKFTAGHLQILINIQP